MKTVKGFSLVELITVIAIIGIMAAVAIVSLVPAKTSTKLNAAGQELMATVKLAQSYAFQGKVVKDNGVNVVPCGFGIYTGAGDAEKYEIFYIFSNDCFALNQEPLNFNNAKSLEEYTLKNGVIFDAGSTGKRIYFTVPHGVIFGNDGNILSDIMDIVLESNDKIKNIQIKPGGVIEEGVVQ